MKSTDRLRKELNSIQRTGVEGINVELVNENDMFKWAVVIFGAPGTLFECGYFKLIMEFPKDYPFSPPTLRFLTPMWHPNVYADGNVCISILHLPGDETLGEHPSEQWNPTRNATTVLLSLILLLDAPNTSSPANVEASLMYRKWKDSSGRDDEYARKVRSLVANTQIDAAQDQVRVPRTTEEYLATATCDPPLNNDTCDNKLDTDWFYDDDDQTTEEEDDADLNNESPNGN